MTFDTNDGVTTVAPGTRKTIEVALGSAPTANYAYLVELAGVGSAVLTSTGDVALGTIPVNNDINYVPANVTVTPIADLDVIAAEWDNTELTVYFNRPVTSTNGVNYLPWSGTGDYNFHVAGSDGTTVESVSAVGKYSVTFTFKDGLLKAGDCMDLSGTIKDAGTDLAGNRLNGGHTVVLTLTADGCVSIDGGTTDLPEHP